MALTTLLPFQYMGENITQRFPTFQTPLLIFFKLHHALFYLEIKHCNRGQISVVSVE